MAAPQPCADGSCCSRAGAVPGVQQSLEEMDFERGEAAADLALLGLVRVGSPGRTAPLVAGTQPRTPRGLNHFPKCWSQSWLPTW
jgi:hypothetical protein